MASAKGRAQSVSTWKSKIMVFRVSNDNVKSSSFIRMLTVNLREGRVFERDHIPIEFRKDVPCFDEECPHPANAPKGLKLDLGNNKWVLVLTQQECDVGKIQQERQASRHRGGKRIDLSRWN